MRLRRLSVRCLLMGHADLIRRESDRMYVECSECGRATRGWTLGRSGRPVFQPAAPVKSRVSEFAAAA
jgi:hypothetical protein